jgi:CRP-like cAMP-binding protein
LQRWAGLPELPDLLRGEDRSFGAGLYVDPIPTTCWFTNVRSCVAPRDWDRLRRRVTRRAGPACEACGAIEDRADRRWLEAHERWDYEHQANTRTLRRLVCVCTDCHRVTHCGLAEVQDVADHALHHLMGVTGLDYPKAKAHVSLGFDYWRARSRRTWTLNLDILTRQGIEVVEPASPTEADVRADTGLRSRPRRPEPGWTASGGAYRPGGLDPRHRRARHRSRSFVLARGNAGSEESSDITRKVPKLRRPSSGDSKKEDELQTSVDVTRLWLPPRDTARWLPLIPLALQADARRATVSPWAWTTRPGRGGRGPPRSMRGRRFPVPAQGQVGSPEVPVSPFLQAEPGDAVGERIAALGIPRRYRPGEYVYRQGETSSWFHVVVSGRVRVFMVRPDGSERVLAYGEPGASLREAACFDGQPRNVSCVATLPSEVLTIHRDTALDAAVSDPEIMREIMRRIAHKQRVAHLHVMIDGLPARERVILLLGHLAEAYGEMTLGPSDITTRLRIRPAVDELALMVGLTRVTMSRELSRLVTEGVLVKDGRTIVVQDLPALRQRVHAVAV